MYIRKKANIKNRLTVPSIRQDDCKVLPQQVRYQSISESILTTEKQCAIIPLGPIGTQYAKTKKNTVHKSAFFQSCRSAGASSSQKGRQGTFWTKFRVSNLPYAWCTLQYIFIWQLTIYASMSHYTILTSWFLENTAHFGEGGGLLFAYQMISKSL